MPWTILLGNNRITDCNGALVVENEEVFRLRERTHDGQLVVDFDLRDESDERIAKIAKNHVVHTAKGFEPRSSPGVYEVVNAESGETLARVEEISPGTVKVTGDFWVNGFHVKVTDDHVKAGPATISGNDIRGVDAAIELKRGSFAIGVSRGR